MRRLPVFLAGAAALGTALSVPGARALRADAHAGTDTAAVSRSIAFFEATLSEDRANTLVATRLVDRYVLRFQQSAALTDLQRAERLARDVVLTSHDPATDQARLSAVLLMQHDFAGAYDAAAAAVARDGARQSALGALFDAALATGRYPQADSLLARLERGTIGWRLRQAQWLDAQGDAEGAYHAARLPWRIGGPRGPRPRTRRLEEGQGVLRTHRRGRPPRPLPAPGRGAPRARR